jgi:hypothetical protein
VDMNPQRVIKCTNTIKNFLIFNLPWPVSSASDLRLGLNHIVCHRPSIISAGNGVAIFKMNIVDRKKQR